MYSSTISQDDCIAPHVRELNRRDFGSLCISTAVSALYADHAGYGVIYTIREGPITIIAAVVVVEITTRIDVPNVISITSIGRP